MLHTGGSISINTGIGLDEQEAGSAVAGDVIREGPRVVTCSIQALVRKDEIYLYEELKQKTTKDVRVTLGDTAAKRMVINMNKVDFTPGSFDVPESGVTPVSLEGICLGTSGEDEIDILMA